jgi:hypothetical protein
MDTFRASFSQIAPPVGRVLIAPRFLNPTLTRSINLCTGSAVAPARSGVMAAGPFRRRWFAVRTVQTGIRSLVSGAS